MTQVKKNNNEIILIFIIFKISFKNNLYLIINTNNKNNISNDAVGLVEIVKLKNIKKRNILLLIFYS